jgi:outer membrane protein TolC
MKRAQTQLVILTTFLIFSSVLALAQSPTENVLQPAQENPFFGGVATEKPAPEPIPLSLQSAIRRGLEHNLGVLIAEQHHAYAEGGRWRALSDLLPNLRTETFEASQQINLATFGFTGFPGTPQIIGPFSVFDTRAYLSQSILNFKKIYHERSASSEAKAAKYSLDDARDLVVLVCANLYLRSVAASSRIDAAKAELTTAQALYNLSQDLKKAGIAPGIDVLRSQVEFQTQQQRLTTLTNDYAKEKLDLLRAIGLPLGQEITLTTALNDAALPPMTLENALKIAMDSRADLKREQALVEAAEQEVRSASAERYPALALDADYGLSGEAANNSHGTYRVAAQLSFPIFDGGSIHGRVAQADATLRLREAEENDLRGKIEYEVRTAFLDMTSSAENTQVARTTLELAQEQLTQAKDRFSAGVSNNIEVLQAQQALSVANENYISSLYIFNLSKGTLARALGIAEEEYQKFIIGE